MRKIILSLIVGLSVSHSLQIEYGPGCAANGLCGAILPVPCIPVPYSNSVDFNIAGMFQEIDDLIEQRIKGSGSNTAEQHWQKINALFDKINETNIKKLELLKNITAIEQAKTLDKEESTFNLIKEQQLLNNYGNIISKGK